MYANVSHVVFEFDWENIKVATGCNVVVMFPNFFRRIMGAEMHPVIYDSDGLGNKNT